MRDHTPRLIISAVAVGFLAAACTSLGGGSASKTPAPATSAPPSSAPASGTPSAPSNPAGKPGTPGCTTAGLTVTAGTPDDAAGHSYQDLVFTNSGSTPCVIGGFPGVSYVTGAGTQIGAPADRTGAGGGALTLASGGQAHVTLTITHVGPLPGCEQASETAPASAYRIYPPANTGSLLLHFSTPAAACSNPSVHQLRVTAMTY